MIILPYRNENKITLQNRITSNIICITQYMCGNNFRYDTRAITQL